ncbi:hypothetical protein BH09MYX1_BH09MYX1_30080 [soil metagenome]
MNGDKEELASRTLALVSIAACALCACSADAFTSDSEAAPDSVADAPGTGVDAAADAAPHDASVDMPSGVVDGGPCGDGIAAVKTSVASPSRTSVKALGRPRSFASP